MQKNSTVSSYHTIPQVARTVLYVFLDSMRQGHAIQMQVDQYH